MSLEKSISISPGLFKFLFYITQIKPTLLMIQFALTL